MTPASSGRAGRVNARLPAEVARKAAYLARRTGMTTTEVLIESLERYYAAVISEEAAPAPQLLADFVGCSEGPADLSTSYKRELSRSLSAKQR
jgi:hypothetical protein